MTAGDRWAGDLDPTTVFDPVAGAYRSARPGYPDELYETLAGVVGNLAGQNVADLGAGTGIAAVALAARKARVVAVEPSRAMLGQFRSALPGVAAVQARAERLPLRADSVDLVTCAQAWHWVDVPPALAECRRVLGPAGRLALWWNVSDSGAPWLEGIKSVGGLDPYGVGPHQDDDATLTGGGNFHIVESWDGVWEWQVPVEQWMTVAATRSTMARLGDDARRPLAAIGNVLRRQFPSGVVTEPFTCHLVVAVPA